MTCSCRREKNIILKIQCLSISIKCVFNMNISRLKCHIGLFRQKIQQRRLLFTKRDFNICSSKTNKHKCKLVMQI